MKPLNDMIKSNYEIEVLVNGRPLKEYMHRGKWLGIRSRCCNASFYYDGYHDQHKFCATCDKRA